MPDRIRFSWLAPFAYGALLALAGAVWLVQGESFDPVTYGDVPVIANESLRAALALRLRTTGGNSALLAGFLVMAVAVTVYRSGARWAW